MSVMNQITTMRLPGGKEVAFVDWNDKPLYSTVDLLAGFTDTEILAFTYVVGDQVPGTTNATVQRTASERDTNTSTPGAMASTEEMLVYAIRPEIFEANVDPNSATDLTTIVTAAGIIAHGPGGMTPSVSRLSILNYFLMLRLEVSQKIMQRAGLQYFNSGMGPTSAGAFAEAQAIVAARAPRTIGNQGLASQEAVRSMSVPIHIGGQEKYYVALENPAGVAMQSGITEDTPPTQDTEIVHSIRINLDGLYKRPVS